jgi:hypothetical protein
MLQIYFKIRPIHQLEFQHLYQLQEIDFSQLVQVWGI